ncbi:contractile injection system protein, VgrG/Pvc8 family [uncultured Pseudomonas sp.]|uniref:contractile injection system protein, VgrG/Pvc8 family n=1 Tax=uncultured Pseudomonas sp. TaxID=114707 RepID=UPI0026327B6B|nr:contractile injection system protein, VgrG/Pvc8 family [uncultured Pseudomonas sp.]
MSLGFTPQVEVYGSNADLINARLIDWERVDAAGIESDRLHLTVDMTDLDGLPTFGGNIGIRVGYKESGLVDRGEYVVTRRTPHLFPPRLLIVATAAPFKVADETEFKARRSASYGPTTLGAIFRQLAGRHGFSPRVAPELDALEVAHLDQSNETDMAFLTRIARQYDAVAKPVNELYVLARRGQVKSLSGKALAPVTLSVTTNNSPDDASFINATLDEDARIKFKGCRTVWWDGESGKECIVETGSAPFEKIRQRHPDEAQAKAAGEGRLRKLEREALKVRIDAPGNPAFEAEGLVVLDGSWPSYMTGSWSVDRVTESGSRQQSYRAVLEASLPAG